MRFALIIAVLLVLAAATTAGAVTHKTFAQVDIVGGTDVSGTLRGADAGFRVDGDPHAGVQISLEVRDARGRLLASHPADPDLRLDETGHALASFPPPADAEPRLMTLVVCQE